MNDLIEQLMHMDSVQSYTGVHALITAGRYSGQTVFMALQVVLNDGRTSLRLAYVLALVLDKNHKRHPCISLALAAGGLEFGHKEYETRGINLLLEQNTTRDMEKLGAPLSMIEPEFIEGNIIYQVFAKLMRDVLSVHNKNLTMRAIRILQAAVPEFRTMFDWNMPVQKLSLDEMCRRGNARSCLMINPTPPHGVPRQRHRVLAILPHHYAIGIRLGVAMDRYGWDTELLEASPILPAEADCRLVFEQFQKNPDIEILFLHASIVAQKNLDQFIAMRHQLLRDYPKLKILGIFYDIEEYPLSTLEKLSDLFDGIISLFPIDYHKMVEPNYAVLTDKMLYNFICPVNDNNFNLADKPLNNTFLFRGSIYTGHWMRAVWVSVMDYIGVRLILDVNRYSCLNESFKLSPLDDYTAYMRDLSEATCGISLVTMHRNSRFVRYLTCRSYEIPLSGSLLVQEYSPLMYHRFIPGEHFFEFTTISELRSIAQFIAEHPEEAEAVRRRGNAFAREQYNDEKVVGQIDYFLYHRH